MAKENNYTGLTTKEAEHSREVYGANVYEEAKKRSFFMRLYDNLKDPIIRILLVAMVVNLLFTIKNINWAENVGMVIAIVVSTFVSALSEQGSEQAFEKIKAEERRTFSTVMRDGEPVRLPSGGIVVGDLVLLSPGERIPADGELLTGNISVDESTINGESKPRAKRKGDRVFAGTLIVSGEGSVNVTKVGSQSVYGQIAREIQQMSGESPLKMRLGKLAKTITKLGYIAAVIVALTYLFNVFVIDAGYVKTEILARLFNLRYLAMHLVKAVTIAMTVIVVAVPEGLPMMISVVLSANMKKMMRDNVLVRKPVGIETAGCMNVLFFDKTGTLTYGKPVCTKLIFGDGREYDGRGTLPDRMKDLIDLSLHTNSSCVKTKDGYAGGNATDRALAAFTRQELKLTPTRKEPFDSTKKYALCEIEYGGSRITLVKGAPEKILRCCRDALGEDGRKKAFERGRIEKITTELSKDGKRIVALAYAEGEGRDERLPEEMIFLAIAVMSDGLRKDAKDAVRALKSAGVHTVMITGDGKETAQSIAVECGICDESSPIVLDGAQLCEKTDAWLKDNIDKLAVISRAMPNDKQRLVRICREKGLIVGMTGDGVNDAPAIKSADVGFALGSGNEIAKEAGDVIILDDDLRSIVNAVLYGRTIFKSIRKFITFQLIMNICAVGVTLFGQLMGIDHPVTVIQMLWVNMIMDTLGGLAFAGEYPMKYYLKEAPIARDEPILRRKTLFQVLVMGAYGMAMCTTFLKNDAVKRILDCENDQTKLLTAFFALFIFTGVMICFTARSERMNILIGLWKNKSFVFIMCGILAIQLCMLFFGGSIFRCGGFDARSLIVTLASASTVLPVDAVRRLIGSKIEKRALKKTRRRFGTKIRDHATAIDNGV